MEMETRTQEARFTSVGVAGSESLNKQHPSSLLRVLNQNKTEGKGIQETKIITLITERADPGEYGFCLSISEAPDTEPQIKKGCPPSHRLC